jgi:hypothetical protein
MTFCVDSSLEILATRNKANSNKDSTMKSVKELRSQGFTVQPAVDAVGCTEVSSNSVFFYYNPYFAKSPAEVVIALKQADQVDGRYRIIIAGNCPADGGDIPFAIVDEQLRQQAESLYNEHARARDAARDAEQKFYDSVRLIMSH